MSKINIMINVLFKGGQVRPSSVNGATLRGLKSSISSISSQEGVLGIVFVRGDTHKVLETSQPYSETKIDSIAKILTDYYE